MRPSTGMILVLMMALSASAQQKINVAVVDLEGNGVNVHEARTLTEKLRSELYRTGRYVIIERSQMEQILKEQGFQQTGCTSSACVVEMGQLLGATSMIAGSIGKVGPIFLVSLRLIDVGTGKILQNVDVEIEGGIADVLRRGIPRIARKIAGQSVPETVPAKPVTTTEPAPVRTATVASSTRNGMGTLAVNCNFRDAKVLVDNEVVSTPATLKLPAGDHSVIGKLEGAGDFNEIVTIDPGAKHTVDVEIGNPYGLGGLGWYGGMLGCIAYGISMFVMAGDDMNYDVGIGAGIGLMSTGGLFGFLGTRKFVQRARWRRNHDIALEVDPGAAALRICILRSGNP